MAATAAATSVDRQAELETEIQRLVGRLEDGFDKISEAALNGQDTTRWEDVWIKLLADYEALYDEQHAR